MENKLITNHAELVLRIMHLKSEKFSQEVEIQHNFKELVYTLNPATILKNLAGDEDVKSSLAKAGLSLGSNYVLDKVLGRNRSIRGFLISVLVEKISTIVINNSGVISKIGNLFVRKSSQKSIHG